MIYRYYVMRAPMSVANVPKGFVNHHRFAGRMFIPSIQRYAYGYIEYDRPVQIGDLERYFLVEEFMPRYQWESIYKINRFATE